MRIACTALSMVPWAVTTMTAMVWASLAIRSSNSSPLMRGILRSVTTMEGDQAVTFSNPSAPSRAVSARYPQAEMSSARPVRSFSSSSTISTFSWLIEYSLFRLAADTASGEKTVLARRRLAIAAPTRLRPDSGLIQPTANDQRRLPNLVWMHKTMPEALWAARDQSARLAELTAGTEDRVKEHPLRRDVRSLG